MQRYTRIRGLALGQTQLPLPLSVRIARKCEPLPAGGDGDAFATSIQLGRPTITAEVRLRGISAVEGLALGDSGDLSFTVDSAAGSQPPRAVTLRGAVVCAIELDYDQRNMACALLRLVAASVDGLQDPFTSEDQT